MYWPERQQNDVMLMWGLILFVALCALALVLEVSGVTTPIESVPDVSPWDTAADAAREHDRAELDEWLKVPEQKE